MLKLNILLTLTLFIAPLSVSELFAATDDVDISSLKAIKLSIVKMEQQNKTLKSKLFDKQAEYVELETALKKISREQERLVLEYNVTSKLLELNESYQEVLNRLLTRQATTANELRSAKRHLEEKLIDIEKLASLIELNESQIDNNQSQFEDELKILIDTTASTIAAEGIKPFTVNVAHEEVCGAAETPISCQERGMMAAKRKLVESAGLKITSVSQLENFEIVKDSVISDASLEIKNFKSDSTFAIQNGQIVNVLKLVGDVVAKSQGNIEQYVLVASNMINAKLQDSVAAEQANTPTVDTSSSEIAQNNTTTKRTGPSPAPQSAKSTNYVTPTPQTATAINNNDVQVTLTDSFESGDSTIPNFVDIEIQKAGTPVSLIVSDTEITVAQFSQFQQETGYTTESESASKCMIYDYSSRISVTADSTRPGYPISDSHPIVCVSVIDAINYTK
ncbi:hypothetical protein BFC17_04550 [Alteromonas lipolytica]|uniref:Sulfatase-modifying factor enzyme-like domain-containing protein n=1 Tax=Alteromonas lipolytica TaxID=1856405 RepID=A0A1E8FDI4_9ALTE|nr:hypothetical protein BFC17_04550 [Alteromonas lipolytica]